MIFLSLQIMQKKNKIVKNFSDELDHHEMIIKDCE